MHCPVHLRSSSFFAPASKKTIGILKKIILCEEKLSQLLKTGTSRFKLQDEQ
uniref:Uncharacterized protein n=1 Tax=Nelumbo nucifera TaxID=4432 RepID=A0A822YU54_NELNU|nr:TPA_asm: hypothetical protein HUJ06_008275 [Nelumbo nucifera]